MGIVKLYFHAVELLQKVNRGIDLPMIYQFVYI